MYKENCPAKVIHCHFLVDLIKRFNIYLRKLNARIVIVK